MEGINIMDNIGIYFYKLIENTEKWFSLQNINCNHHPIPFPDLPVIPEIVLPDPTMFVEFLFNFFCILTTLFINLCNNKGTFVNLYKIFV